MSGAIRGAPPARAARARGAWARRLPLLALAVSACRPCQPPPPPPASCKSDSDCPPGDACLAGSCNPLTEVLANLAAAVAPSSPDLAPQEFRGVNAIAPSTPTLRLTPPQLLTGAFQLPPACLASEALPITLLFTGHPFIPLLDWTFQFTTDEAGVVHGALPANEQFAVWITTASPCAAPIFGTDDAIPGPVPAGARWPFPGAGDVLTVAGTVTAPGAAEPLAGASITIKGAQGIFAGTTLSATTTTRAGPVGFVLPVPLAQVLAQPDADGGLCAPPPLGSCAGESCPPLPPCARLTLEVGPSPSVPELPVIDVPIAGRLDLPPDGGVAAGPLLSLTGADGLGVRLPIGPSQTALVSGRILDPGGAALAYAAVSADGLVILPGGACGSGCRYRIDSSSSETGSFALPVPPGGDYTLTATPPPGDGFAPASIAVPNVPATGAGGLDVRVRPGVRLSGQVLDPEGGAPVGGGEAQLLGLSTGALVALAAVAADGTFSATVPPGRYLVTVHPPDSTGLPDRAQPIDLTADTSLSLTFFPGARLQGAVVAESTGMPVPLASIRLFYIDTTQEFGTFALPIASGVTDPQGQFSVTVPSATSASP